MIRLSGLEPTLSGTVEFDIQRHFRDARLFVIGDGSSQIQRSLIARQMGL